MSDNGLIERCAHPEDRRAVALRVTDDGAQTLRAGLSQRRAGVNAMLAVLDQNECEALSRVLEKLSAHLSDAKSADAGKTPGACTQSEPEAQHFRRDSKQT